MAGLRARFEMYRDGNRVWTLEGIEDDIPMMTGLADVFSYFSVSYKINVDFRFFLIGAEGGERLLDLYNIYLIGNVATEGLVVRGNMILSDEQVATIGERFVLLSKVDKGDDGYVVIAFDSPRFLQGFIMGSSACGVDFRDLLLCKPFKLAADRSVTYYDIQGYPIANPPNTPTRM